ncbi:D-alanine aminotransferase [Methylobrevis pamukkalensis]|uniref:Probable branched-chain-amino-acid aminotransferase n=1 Tax=Methylobrevis pamukkalensis TaxID=1439726 RepID=A0A1E3H1M9_9HYPH|nr:D-alanine aminotransferase [Methylobrevis pamukkalensis]
MSSERIVYVNGAYVAASAASVSVFDRGFLFADAVYEVTTVLDGRLIDFAGHVARLHRSLGELQMTLPVSEADLLAIHRKLVADNGVTEGLVYLQISRGSAERDFGFPDPAVPPTIVLFTQNKTLIDSPMARRGAKIVLVDDLRWGRCDIKTVQLLYPSLAKMAAKEQGADDAWLVRDGLVTEGTSNNAHIVTTDGRIVTRHLGPDILSGITRAAMLRIAHEQGLVIEERGFTPDEAKAAAEASSPRDDLRHGGGVDRRHADRRRHARPRREPPARGLYRREPEDGDLIAAVPRRPPVQPNTVFGKWKDTTKFGTSTISLIRRSPATEQSM